jgi:4-amino-4-deoxy-L-arabinose transferase-like glycosyltransferase
MRTRKSLTDTKSLILALIILLALAVRVALIFRYGVDHDEDAYSHTINSYVTSKTWVYPWAAWLPLYHYFGALAIALLGRFVEANVLCRLVSAVFGSLTIIPVYRISRRIFGERAGLIASVLLATAPSLFMNLSTSAMAEVPFAFLLLMSISLFLEERFVLSSIFLALSSLTRYEGWVVTPLFILFALGNRKLSLSRKAAVIVIPVLAILYWLAWNQVQTGSVFVFYLAEIKSGGYTPIHFLKLLSQSMDHVLLFLSIVGIYESLKEKLDWGNLTVLLMTLLIFLFHSFRGITGGWNLGGWDIRYLAPLTPFLVIYAASGLVKAVSLVPSMLEFLIPPRLSGFTRSGLLVKGVLVASLVVLCSGSLVLANHELSVRDRDSRWASLRSAGLWLRANSGEQDRILADSSAIKYYVGLERPFVSFWDVPASGQAVYTYLKENGVRFIAIVDWEDWYPSARNFPELMGGVGTSQYVLRGSFGWGTYIYEIV